MSAQELRKHAYVRIVEEPASKALRFRYECEGRSAGSIPGASSTPENKTFPSIQIVGYTGRAVVVVSCVTKDRPYRPHPNNLVGRRGCKNGVCTLQIAPETMSVAFPGLGIQCIKKKDIEAALKVRSEICVDPFKTGFCNGNQLTTTDLNVVRLCFQVFLESEKDKFTIPLQPVVSQPIFNKKAMHDLLIVGLSDCVSYVDGGKKDMILLCEKVAKDDIEIRFFEKKNGQIVWEGLGEFGPTQVHNGSAIIFRTPRYLTLDVTEPVKVFVQLKRPSDGTESDPVPFELLPISLGQTVRMPKRQKIDGNVLSELQDYVQLNNLPQPSYGGQIADVCVSPISAPNLNGLPQCQSNQPEHLQYNNLSCSSRRLVESIPQNCNIQKAPPRTLLGHMPSANINGSQSRAIGVGCLVDLGSRDPKTNLISEVTLPNIPHNNYGNYSSSHQGSMLGSSVGPAYATTGKMFPQGQVQQSNQQEYHLSDNTSQPEQSFPQNENLKKVLPDEIPADHLSANMHLENSPGNTFNNLLDMSSDELMRQALYSTEFATSIDNLSDSFSTNLSLCENGRS